MDQTANEGSTTSFTCQVTGEPVPTISWFINGVSINNGSNLNKYILQRSLNATMISSTLRVLNLQSSDVGTYTCNATNVVSTDTSSGVLTVNSKGYTYISDYVISK